MSPLQLGNIKIGRAYLGNERIARMYIGQTLVFGSLPEPATGTMFLLNRVGRTGGGLYTVDPETGNATLVGNIVDSIRSIAFHQGKLYGGYTNLYEINPNTGATTLIGNQSRTTTGVTILFAGMVSIDNALYGWSSTGNIHQLNTSGDRDRSTETGLGNIFDGRSSIRQPFGIWKEGTSVYCFANKSNQATLYRLSLVAPGQTISGVPKWADATVLATMTAFAISTNNLQGYNIVKIGGFFYYTNNDLDRLIRFPSTVTGTVRNQPERFGTSGFNLSLTNPVSLAYEAPPTPPTPPILRSLAVVGSVGNTTATISIDPLPLDGWRYSLVKGSSTVTACSNLIMTKEVSLTGLSVGTEHTITGFSATGCTDANRYDSETFTTGLPPFPSILSLRTKSTSTIDVDITPSEGGSKWYTLRSGGNVVRSCTSDLTRNGGGVTVEDLEGGTAYTITVYSSAGCTPELRLAEGTFTTDSLPTGTLYITAGSPASLYTINRSNFSLITRIGISSIGRDDIRDLTIWRGNIYMLSGQQIAILDHETGNIAHYIPGPNVGTTGTYTGIVGIGEWMYVAWFAGSISDTKTGRTGVFRYNPFTGAAERVSERRTNEPLGVLYRSGNTYGSGGRNVAGATVVNGALYTYTTSAGFTDADGRRLSGRGAAYAP